MKEFLFRRYGRDEINQLDWLLAITCCVISIGSLLFSIGVAIQDVADLTLNGFMTFVRGMGFVLDINNGNSAIVSAYINVLFYGALLLLVLGIIYLKKKNADNRIPGVVAAFIAIIGLLIFLGLSMEFINGKNAGKLHLFWPIALLIFVALLAALAVVSIIFTFNFNHNINLYKDTAKTVGEAREELPDTPVNENKTEEDLAEQLNEELAEEQEEVEESTPIVEEKEDTHVAEQPSEEEVVEDEEDEDEEMDVLDSDEDEKGNPFDSMGERRKRLPFESKLKKLKPETRERYEQIVEAYRKYQVNDRKSIPGEAFSYKKVRLVFIAISGKTLKVFFRLDPQDFADSTIPIKDVSELKKYEETPSCLIIKSGLAARRAAALGEKIFKDRKIPTK